MILLGLVPLIVSIEANVMSLIKLKKGPSKALKLE